MTADLELPNVEVHHDAEHGVTEVRLDNGLLALVAPRTGSPVVSVQAWYAVGSREEDKGQTGLAHYLEHLMFKGTATLRKGDIDLVTLRNGGANNADTTTDRTRYYFQLAADRWERGLEIEADRMRGSAFDEHEFESERGPVIEELRRDRDDPWWALNETLEATAFQVHPYRNPVIGWPEEIVKVPREPVLAFYDRYYQPWNCTLVIVGDVDPAEVATRVAELFGPIPRAEPYRPFIPAEPAQEGERRFELELAVNLPRFICGFHTVRARDPEDAALDVLQVLLSGGKSSILHDRLVRRDRLASMVYASNDTRRDPGIFSIMLELQGDADRAAAEGAVWEELERLATDGPEPEAFERARALIRAGHVYRQSSAAGMAEAIGTMQVLGGDWRLLYATLERVATMTTDDVRDVVRRFFHRRNRTVGWAVPRPEGAPGRPPVPENEVELPDEEPDDTRPAPAILDRLPAAPLEVSLPATRVELPNGLRVLALHRPGAGEVAVQTWVDAGQLREARPGLAALTGACLDEGAGGRTSLQLAEELAARGTHLDAGAAGVAFRCITEHTDHALDVLADTLRRQTFSDEPLARKRGELMAHLRSEDDNPAFTGSARLRASIYGAHPFARRSKGSAEDLAALTVDDLAAHHAGLFVPRSTIIGVVGDLEADDAIERVTARLGDWDDREPTRPAFSAPELATAGTDIHVDEERDQLHIYFGHLGVRRAEPDYFALLLGDYVLGSGPGFSDRMSRRLRDEQGLAYTVWARIARSADIEPGIFCAYMGTAPDQFEVATAGMRREIGAFVSGAEPVTQTELDDARRYLIGHSVFAYETNQRTAAQLVALERLGLGLDYPQTFRTSLEAVTIDDVQAAAARHIHPDRLAVVTVGRRA